MARGWKVNKPKVTLESYPPIILMGVPKIGKTHFFRDLVHEYTGGAEGGVLLSIGKEKGAEALDGLQYENVYYWDKAFGEDEEGLHEDLQTRGLIQAIDELVETKATNGIKLVCLDTIDELYSIAEQPVFELHRKQNGKYPTSINEALKGYGKGQAKMMELVSEQVERLDRAGYGVILLGHTKIKEQEDVMSGIKYDVLTNNMPNNFFLNLANVAQMIVAGTVEVEFEGINKETRKTQKDGNIEVQKGNYVGAKRYMYFRNNGFVNAGARFSGLPERLEFSASNFLKAFNMGVESNIKWKDPNATVDIESSKKEEEIINNQKATVAAKADERNDFEDKDIIVERITKFVLDGLKEAKFTTENIKELNASFGIETIGKLVELSNVKIREYEHTVRDL